MLSTTVQVENNPLVVETCTTEHVDKIAPSLKPSTGQVKQVSSLLVRILPLIRNVVQLAKPPSSSAFYHIPLALETLFYVLFYELERKDALQFLRNFPGDLLLDVGSQHVSCIPTATTTTTRLYAIISAVLDQRIQFRTHGKIMSSIIENGYANEGGEFVDLSEYLLALRSCEPGSPVADHTLVPQNYASLPLRTPLQSVENCLCFLYTLFTMEPRVVGILNMDKMLTSIISQYLHLAISNDFLISLLRFNQPDLFEGSRVYHRLFSSLLEVDDRSHFQAVMQTVKYFVSSKTPLPAVHPDSTDHPLIQAVIESFEEEVHIEPMLELISLMLPQSQCTRLTSLENGESKLPSKPPSLLCGQDVRLFLDASDIAMYGIHDCFRDPKIKISAVLHVLDIVLAVCQNASSPYLTYPSPLIPWSTVLRWFFITHRNRSLLLVRLFQLLANLLHVNPAVMENLLFSRILLSGDSADDSQGESPIVLDRFLLQFAPKSNDAENSGFIRMFVMMLYTFTLYYGEHSLTLRLAEYPTWRDSLEQIVAMIKCWNAVHYVDSRADEKVSSGKILIDGDVLGMSEKGPQVNSHLAEPPDSLETPSFDETTSDLMEDVNVSFCHSPTSFGELEFGIGSKFAVSLGFPTPSLS